MKFKFWLAYSQGNRKRIIAKTKTALKVKLAEQNLNTYEMEEQHCYQAYVDVTIDWLTSVIEVISVPNMIEFTRLLSREHIIPDESSRCTMWFARGKCIDEEKGSPKS